MTDPIRIVLSDCTEVRPCVIDDCPRDATVTVVVPPFTPTLQPLGTLNVSVCADHLPPGVTL